MKKSKTIVISLLTLACACSGVYANNVEYPGFHDQFTVTMGSGVLAQISYQGQSGTVYNDPDPTALNCSGNVCHFTLTDNDSWDSSGQVVYLIGDQSKQGPYCVVTVNDGALIPEATMTTECVNGAAPTQLLHNNNQYQFSINMQSH